MGDGAGLDQQVAAVGFSMNVLIPVHFAVAEQAVSEGGRVHSWPDVVLGRSFQCGYFLFGWLLCPYPTYHPLLPSLPPSPSTLCYVLVIVFIPNMYNIAPRGNSMGSSSWGPKDSLKRKEAAVSA